MKDYQHKIITIPNIISMFRVVLIPFIIYSFVKLNNIPLTVVLIAVSALSDILDGKIARKFNMVSDFGKFFDPVADKATQIALAICLAFKIKMMIPLLIFLLIKEIFMGVSGYIVIKRTGAPDQAKWYGKACTVVLYGSMMAMILFPGMPEWLSYALICLCALFMLISIIGYAVLRRREIKKSTTKNNGTEGL
ncbi:MAG: CDP-alcohol phosphatidyltransferase family protein [Clostridia bacterium]|nr:CDP-alcohol phosphatidyltransferase family protein [Clostridia bacterium]